MERWDLPNLPHEIVYDILSRLPVKPLCRFKSVSKPWLALITDPQFIKSHLHQSMKSNSNQKLMIIPPRCSHTFESFYALDYQAPDHSVADLKMLCKNSRVVDIRGSFNGVLLLDLLDGLCLWNPSVRMYQKFSRPKGTCAFRKYALGYDSINDDFKVVAAVCLINHALTNVHVFSSKLSSWKSIGDFGYSSYLQGPGSVLNGAPHWFLCGNTDMYSNIVCFDVMEEKLKEVPKPICEVNNFVSLGALGGWLCVVDNRLESHSDVWVMKEYGVKESWTKLFVVPNVPLNVAGEFFFHYFDLLCFTKDGEVVMRLKLETEELVKFVIYNPKKKTYKRMIGMPQDWKRFDVAVYVESLVSPHGCNSTRRHC
ncbi:F-box protein CPR1-like isoform X4 [Rhododendron vialii]|uniref:F-box protein CPR1-like isoform X4 n=1 Tax=Rhododendron vialii TaxID=182163 RepID=UPI00265F5445|nr:F-box protein CPR1-like isoform X4 [Rhododendron vialii]